MKAPPRAKLEDLARNLGRKNYARVLTRSTKLLSQFPKDQHLWTAHGKASLGLGLGRPSDAVASFAQVLTRTPEAPAAFTDMGDALRAAGDTENAMACYVRSLQIDPTGFAASHNLGLLLRNTGHLKQAVTWFETAIKNAPKQGLAHFNLAETFRQLGDINRAVDHIEKALHLVLDLAEAHFLHAHLLKEQGHLDRALAAVRQAVSREPDHIKFRVEMLSQMAHMADWSWQQQLAKHLKEKTDTANASPFSLLAMEDDPAKHLARSRSYAAQMYPPRAEALPARPRAPDERISIGYFSSDFHEHATLHLMGGLFAAHDRARFRINVYSYDRALEDEARRRVKHSVCQFRDISQISDAQAAALARDDGIDIAVELKGYTGDTRLAIFTNRAAPVQVSWLGYPGSLGAEFIDYIIADDVVIPRGYEKFYSEKVLRLPGSYQVNDDRREISDRVYSRDELGLPADGVVYCCFNATYKICPDVFARWMDILRQVDGSVLWLLATNPWAERNLRAAAERHKIDPDRLIFAERWKAAEHLVRLRSADLFLDTLAVNAHTTASDALWAGVPVLTQIGEQFAARVAASLLTACDLPELITTTRQGYVDLAIALAQDPARLAGLRERLLESHMSAPLFDTKGFVSNLEAAFEDIAPATIRERT